MYLYKYHLDQYIKCPYYFALNIMNKEDDTAITNKAVSSVLQKAAKTRSYKASDNNIDKDILHVRDTVSKIALKEMSTGNKVPLYEYRIICTNKFLKSMLGNRFTQSGASELQNKINNMLSIFVNNVYISYNTPVEIPIKKTNIIYRYVFDFIVADVNDPEKITIIEFDNLSTDIQVKKYHEWLHYKIQYAFLANSLQKTINVIIIDPINEIGKNIELTYDQKTFDLLYNEFCNQVSNVANPVLYRNLYSCDNCEYKKVCFEDK